VIAALYYVHTAQGKERSLSGNLTRISIYIPQNKQKDKPLERLYKLAQTRDRSLNYMILEAVLTYVEREEKKK
jgi:hypothetical protein